MSLLGLTAKFRINRVLTGRDRKLRLDQKKRSSAKPLAQVSVIGINTRYLELVDKYFADKGLCTFVSTFGAVLSIVSMIAAPIAGFSHRARVQDHNDLSLALALAVTWLVMGTTTSWGLWLLRQEAFRYTHYPIRLNRMNRMVYVHRIDGTILRIPWDEVFFTLVQEPMFPSGMGANWAIHGHVLDADGETVRETFAFSVVEIPEIVTAHWEFLRRYMEEGPQAVEKHIEYYVQVSTQEQREPFRHSMRFSLWRYGGFSLALLPLLPLDFLIACARWVAMRTGKLPVWPDDVEAE
ncbi:hypothetical protein AAP84_23965, partial [Salmonella enterica subsp. enterica]|nr:hypothetical protein [Salmonella enterica subsp. enterica serovar Litchfield]